MLGDLLKWVEDYRANPTEKHKDIFKILGKLAKLNQQVISRSSNAGQKKVIKLVPSEDVVKN